jgi:hypothetical protein
MPNETRLNRLRKLVSSMSEWVKFGLSCFSLRLDVWPEPEASINISQPLRMFFRAKVSIHRLE